MVSVSEGVEAQKILESIGLQNQATESDVGDKNAIKARVEKEYVEAMRQKDAIKLKYDLKTFIEKHCLAKGE